MLTPPLLPSLSLSQLQANPQLLQALLKDPAQLKQLLVQFPQLTQLLSVREKRGAVCYRVGLLDEFSVGSSGR